MGDTSTRLLSLLSLLQMRRTWPGEELARRLRVSRRAIRRELFGSGEVSAIDEGSCRLTTLAETVERLATRLIRLGGEFVCTRRRS